MSNRKAPKGKVYFCTACAKRSRDKYGDKAIDYGWDVSCVMHCKLVKEEEANAARDKYYRRTESE